MRSGLRRTGSVTGVAGILTTGKVALRKLPLIEKESPRSLGSTDRRLSQSVSRKETRRQKERTTDIEKVDVRGSDDTQEMVTHRFRSKIASANLSVSEHRQGKGRPFQSMCFSCWNPSGTWRQIPAPRAMER